MKLMIFEWLCGGGLWADSLAPDENCSMQSQGKKMLAAVLDDFLAGGVEVELPLDERLTEQFPDHPRLTKLQICATDQLQDVLTKGAAHVDFILMIAPESDNTLVRCLEWMKPFRTKLIGPIWSL